ncbi:uncharacterized protein RMCN_4867 [Mycolicibacterium novocastrense]|uniref:Uncharacterized protein n=1 Tax=Mycolicibacterium novocastrense TaxID=59813 RepID=A0ABQ0KRI8_MYCNV|nr:uncharacterized protein RMCN_4867 [Mycolicibacterium novocastrense]
MIAPTGQTEIEVNTKQVKLLSAAVGTSALLAMGAFSVASTTAAQDDEPPVTPGPVTTSEITTGETVTDSKAPETPTTSVATPPVTAEPAPTG